MTKDDPVLNELADKYFDGLYNTADLEELRDWATNQEVHSELEAYLDTVADDLPPARVAIVRKAIAAG
jgi:hypothetical protein